ncbi:excalibur calcium-binding domain-containing protein [Flavobacterium cutihirudinis]|uniref:excalibur calcium-binding domain-containing protein n=1 Tax=Flavobacterium cutihirudinis TaxID=1265740 RepID=UPI000E226C3F|nr:excalibur calcium-binding domain-containing protein [Flavobacterium cutihirudinis]
MNHKKITTLLFSLIAIIACAISCSDSAETKSDCPTKTCGDFASQAQAQATYNSDKNCYKNLDSDGDGKACESLK